MKSFSDELPNIDKQKIEDTAAGVVAANAKLDTIKSIAIAALILTTATLLVSLYVLATVQHAL